jgi:hypothetical protein
MRRGGRSRAVRCFSPGWLSPPSDGFIAVADGTVLAVPHIEHRTRVRSTKTRHFLRNREEGRGWGVWGAGTGATGPAPQGSPSTVVTQNSFFCSGVFCLPRQRLTISTPSPRLSSAWFSGVPVGLVVHPSIAVATHRLVTSSDDGLGAWRPILRLLGPLPAQMGGLQHATWIHLTSRNLSCFHRVQFRPVWPWQKPLPRRRTRRLS